MKDNWFKVKIKSEKISTNYVFLIIAWNNT